MTEAYFTTGDGHWFQPTDLARGPWDADACHAGPPTALVVRALERLEVTQRLARLTVELHRPVPMAGFTVEATIRRQGRTASLTHARITDGHGTTCAEAFGLHLTPVAVPTPTAPVDVPRRGRAVPGSFPIAEASHGLPGFIQSVEVAYDPEHGTEAGGPTTMWMRTVPILADEEPSPIQRLGPLADSGNGISWNTGPSEITFPNPDLTINLVRAPVGEWLGSRAITHTSDDGVGLAEAQLFDDVGLVGRATQTLVIRPA